ncbi:hypothetical protein EW145_g2970 [Phellinidium pouzarii]|uniref:HMG box domain-containing protein n=1 Tax=Phellinidium pouzarii TaxID=167371 RepID=A0A4S4LAE7_9AGAM|nr:hypothetical protein EW145_g2970 [Phellinidium pouzarii]
MPSTRTVRKSLSRQPQHLSLGESVFQSGITTVPSTPLKKKKPRNALILFRSHMIADGMLPKEITHQSDVSRWAGVLWSMQDDEMRKGFFRLAEEEKARWMMDDGSEFAITKKKRNCAVHLSNRKPVVPTPTLSSSPHSMQDRLASASVSVGSLDSLSSNDSLTFHLPVDTQLPTTHETNGRSSFELSEDIPPPSLDPFNLESEVIVDMSGYDLSSFAFEWTACNTMSSMSLESELLGFPSSPSTTLSFDTDNLIEEYMNLGSWGSDKYSPDFADKGRPFF